MTQRIVATLTIGFASAVTACAGLGGGWLGGLQAQAEDVLQPGTEAAGGAVVVAIDRRTLDSVGVGWPWPRQLHAELIDALGKAGATVVLHDVLFADERPDDAILAEALGRTPTILASALTLRPRRAEPPVVVQRLGPTAALARAAAKVGHSNVTSAPGHGVVRELPLYALTDRSVVEPSMVLAAVARLEGADQVIERRAGVQVGSRFVPLEAGLLRINWSADLTAEKAIPAVDVLRGVVDPKRLQERIVVVGVTDPTIGDLHVVPVDTSGSTPGVVVLANALNTVMTRAYLTDAPDRTEWGVVAGAGLLTAALFCHGSLLRAIAGSIVTIGAYLTFTTWQFHSAGRLWNVVWPLVAVAVAAVVGTSWRYVGERRARVQAVDLVSQYVPRPVAKRLVDRRAGGLPQGELTFLMTDIVGSTATWEEAPSLMRTAVARHDELVEAAVEGHHGAVVRPRGEGDSRFAVFLSGQDAAEAALAISAAVALEQWMTPTAIRLRIGISAGEGELRGGDYYGPDVNLCARIRAAAEPGQVLVSAAVAAGLGPPVETVDLGVHHLKDIVRPETLFEIRANHSAADAP